MDETAKQIIQDFTNTIEAIEDLISSGHASFADERQYEYFKQAGATFIIKYHQTPLIQYLKYLAIIEQAIINNLEGAWPDIIGAD